MNAKDLAIFVAIIFAVKRILDYFFSDKEEVEVTDKFLSLPELNDPTLYKAYMLNLSEDKHDQAWDTVIDTAPQQSAYLQAIIEGHWMFDRNAPEVLGKMSALNSYEALIHATKKSFEANQYTPGSKMNEYFSTTAKKQAIQIVNRLKKYHKV